MLREMSLTIALLFISCGALASAQKTAGGSGVAESAVRVSAGEPLTVECPVRVEQRAEWRLNGSALPADVRPAGERPAGEGLLAARVHAAQARAHHAGVYTCSAGPGAARVRVSVLPPPAAAAAAAAAAPADAEAGAGAGAGEPARDFAEVAPQIVYYDINRNISLRCPLKSADKDSSYSWMKNDSPVEKVAALKERYQLLEEGSVLKVVGKAQEEDYGNYSCALGGELHAWDVRGRPFVRLPENTNVVENQDITLQCKVLGKPSPVVWWTYNASEASNSSERLEAGARGGRVELAASEHGVAGAALLLRRAERGDAGLYACHAAHAGLAPAADHTTLRVKDMYAALWPFLGICAEVFVLCAIILVYEKRRTKPELDDSDTDNHDQKKS